MIGPDRELITHEHPSGLFRFLRGDCNDDGTVDISDAIFTLGPLFLGDGDPDCDDACDSNDDGVPDISDAIRILLALFVDGRGMPPPYPAFGEDPTEDFLDCAAVCREPCEDTDDDGIFDVADCEPFDPSVYPGADELLDNGVDDDCDARTPDRDRLVVPPSVGEVDNNFSVDLSARLDGGGTVELLDAAGVVERPGQPIRDVVIYAITSFGGIYVFAGVEVSRDGDSVGGIWFYCEGVTGERGIFTAMYRMPARGGEPSGNVMPRGGVGACTWSLEPSTTQVALGGLDTPLPEIPPLAANVSMYGLDLQVGGTESTFCGIRSPRITGTEGFGESESLR